MISSCVLCIQQATKFEKNILVKIISKMMKILKEMKEKLKYPYLQNM